MIASIFEDRNNTIYGTTGVPCIVGLTPRLDQVVSYALPSLTAEQSTGEQRAPAQINLHTCLWASRFTCCGLRPQVVEEQAVLRWQNWLDISNADMSMLFAW